MTAKLASIVFAAATALFATGATASTFDFVETSATLDGSDENMNGFVDVGETAIFDSSIILIIDPLFGPFVGQFDQFDFDILLAADAAPTLSFGLGTLNFAATNVLAPQTIGVTGFSIYILGVISGPNTAELPDGTEASLILSSNTGQIDNLSTASLSVPPQPVPPIPLPAGLPLLAGGLGVLALMRRTAK